MEKLALVTGGTGFIGSALIRRLTERGWKVRALVRHDPIPQALPQSTELMYGDIVDSNSVRRAVEGTNAVFHLAAKLHIDNPAPELRKEYQDVNTTGTSTIVSAVKTLNVPRLIFFSTINVYGPSDPEQMLDEDSPPRPQSVYAQTKLEGEQTALEGSPCVVLRLAAVYGPGMKGNYVRLYDMLKRGRFVYVGKGNNLRTLIYIDDVCDAAILSAEHPLAINRIFNLTDGSVHTLREIVNAICFASGRRPPRLSVPKPVVYFAARIVEACFGALNRNPPIGRHTVDKLVEQCAVSGSRIQNEIGFHPTIDLVRGWQKTVSHWRT